MPLATTCPHCKTSFAVTPEQLERGRGDVRCGACKQVFAGGDYLRYLGGSDAAPDAAPDAPSAAPSAAPDAAAAARDRDGRQPSGTDAWPPRGGGRGDGHAPVVGPQAKPGFPPAASAPLFPAPGPGEWDPLQAMSEPAVTADDRHRPVSDDGVTARNPSFDEAADAGRAGGPRQAGDAHAASDPAHANPAQARPSQAIFTQAPSRWRESAAMPEPSGHTGPAGTPWYGWALVALILLAALLLMLLFRSEIANQFPAARPVVGAIAGAFGLPVGGVRSIGSLSIESTELQRSGSNGPASLHALLRNKDSRTIAWPALELTLSDQAGTVVLRKVILPADYLPAGAPPDGLRGRSEQPLRIGMDTGALPLANYSVTLFYP